jgi:citrate lyase beta subunit
MTPPIAHRRGSTWLITPGTAPARFDAARDAGADVALVDLEDSVPHHSKDTARTAALQFLSSTAEPGEGDAPVLGLRLNAPSTVHGLKDLVAVAECGHTPAVLLIPKVESPRDIELVADVVNAEAVDPGVGGAGVGDADDSEPRVWALIETPRAIERLPEILRARPLAGVVFGAADYAAAVGCRRDRATLRYPRSALAASAAAAGLPAIDSPFFDLTDADGLSREAEEARDLGFVGKGAIHPAQLAIIRDTFTPSPQELAAAVAVVAAADSAHGGIATVDGHMVGPPLVTAARAVCARAGATQDRFSTSQDPSPEAKS